MPHPDFESIASRLRARHGLTSLGNGSLGGAIDGMKVSVRRARGHFHSVAVVLDVGPHQAARVRAVMEERVLGLPSEVLVEFGGKGSTVRALITDPGSMLDPLAVVGAIEAVAHAVSLAAVASTPTTVRARSAGLSSAVNQT